MLLHQCGIGCRVQETMFCFKNICCNKRWNGVGSSRKLEGKWREGAKLPRFIRLTRESQAVPESEVHPMLEDLGNGVKKLCSVVETEIELPDVDHEERKPF